MPQSTKASAETSVLVVDDVPSTRALLIDMLRDLGFTRCVEATDGTQALEVLKTQRVDLILCDYLMEGMSGIEFITSLQRCDETAPPVLLVSALGDVSSVETAIKVGACDYLVKPVSFRKLRRKVESALGTCPEAASFEHTF
jgi:CheY-like chemotaxis protein